MIRETLCKIEGHFAKRKIDKHGNLPKVAAHLGRPHSPLLWPVWAIFSAVNVFVSLGCELGVDFLI